MDGERKRKDSLLRMPRSSIRLDVVPPAIMEDTSVKRVSLARRVDLERDVQRVGIDFVLEVERAVVELFGVEGVFVERAHGDVPAVRLEVRLLESHHLHFGGVGLTVAGAVLEGKIGEGRSVSE